MANVNERRINFNEDDYEIVKRLLLENTFKKLQLIEIFALDMIFGKKQGFRTPLDGKKTGRIRNETVEHSDVNYLMMAIAVEETGSFDILAKRNDYFTICEEYAKTGLSFLESEYFENPKRLVNDLELESLDVVDLVVAFEKEFNIKIDDKDIKQFQTVEDIVKYLEK